MTTAESNLQKELKKVSSKDREYIQSGLEMLGPDPDVTRPGAPIFA